LVECLHTSTCAAAAAAAAAEKKKKKKKISNYKEPHTAPFLDRRHRTRSSFVSFVPGDSLSPPAIELHV
jgi:hypothetical protein